MLASLITCIINLQFGENKMTTRNKNIFLQREVGILFVKDSKLPEKKKNRAFACCNISFPFSTVPIFFFFFFLICCSTPREKPLLQSVVAHALRMNATQNPTRHRT
ncbi:unnamed protein product [Ixodes persulcatus]